MLDIKFTDTLRSHLQKLSLESDTQFTAELAVYLKNDTMSIKAFRDIYRDHWLDKGLTVRSLLSPLEFKGRKRFEPGEHYTPQFRSELRRLELIQKEQEYQGLIRKVDHLGIITPSGPRVAAPEDTEKPSQLAKEIKEQISAVFNVGVTVFSAIWALWYWSGSSASFPDYLRVLLCLTGGIVVLIADIALYAGYKRKITEAKMRERQRKQVKRIINTISINKKED